MQNIDTAVQSYVSLIRTQGLTQFFYLLTIYFDLTIYFVLIVLCVASLIYLFRNLRYTILFLGSLGVGAVVVYLMKGYFNVSRPPDALFTAFGQSFPSWHATMATIFFVMLMYTFDDLESHFVRICFNIFCVASIFLVAISRVYLGVHWVSDVSFGILLGCVISFANIHIFKRFLVGR